MKLFKDLFATILVGAILSFLANLIFLSVLKKLNLSPFYHGAINPNYIETLIFGALPFLFSMKFWKSLQKNDEFRFLSYIFIITMGILGWGIGIFIQTASKILEDPNDTFYLGHVGGLEWNCRQTCFLASIIIGVTVIAIIEYKSQYRN